MNKRNSIIILFLFFYTGITFSQFNEIKELEAGLVNRVKMIYHWHNMETNENNVNKYDSLVMENSIFTQKLYDLLKSNRNSVNYDFSGLRSNGVYIATSKDKNLRIFSWDTFTGGTMHMFNSILQYSFENKVSARILNNVLENNGEGAGYYFPIIYQVKPNIYLAVDNAIYSTKDVYTGIRGFNIENGTLNDTIGIFKTKQGLVNEVGTGYDFFSIADVPFEKQPAIFYDETKQEISVPMTDFENDLTGQYIKFLYNGSYFIKEMMSDK